MKQLIPILSISLFFFSCNQPTQRMKNFEVHGIDVSHHQSNIDWDTVAAQDIHFAFAKATEGETHNDSLFCYNWEEMKRVGIKRGAYHFFRPMLSAYNQVENFTDWVELEIGDLPPVLDVEVLDGLSKIELINKVRAWLFLMEIKCNIKPIIYTNQKFYNKYLAGYFGDYPIWIARYSSWRKPHLRKPPEWTFWQYGDKGQLKGVDGPVDFNVFRGNVFELNEMCLAERMVLSQR